MPSIDELVAIDATSLDSAGVRALAVELERAKARLDAALLAVAGELDRNGWYLDDGAAKVRCWLAHHSGIARATAGSRVRLAKRLRFTPLMADALAAGAVSEGHARALARCLTPRTLVALTRDEALLVDQAKVLCVDDYEVLVTRWLSLNDDGPEPGTGEPSQVRASRYGDGRVKLDGDLDIDDGAELLAELDAITDELWREDQRLDDHDPAAHRSHAQRCAAALLEMARRSSATRRQDLEDDVAEADRRERARPRRAQLIVTVPLDALAGARGVAATFDDGTLVPRSTLERWLCDCATSTVSTKAGVPFDVGRSQYTPSPAQRRALVARDGGCIVPSCNRPARWCDAHHVVPHPAGPTQLDNLVLLCNRHHKLAHNHTIRLRPASPQRWIVLRGDGTPIRERPPPIPLRC
ncbi:MAG TPA: DUF222 domain-containing protein [Acidimicrobiales bacterium]|nr:DUF222 domain-containing protein [Acidimicrobiales bacterium]